MIKDKNIFSKFWKELNSYNDFMITTHVNPDGDAITSVILMGYILSKLNKTYKIVLNSPIPEKLQFLTNKYYNILIPELLIVPDGVDLLTQFKENYFPEAIIILDTCGEERLAEFKKYFNKAKAILNVDHHIGKRGFPGVADVVNETAASTGEVIFDILKENNFELDKTSAELIYTSIVNDTRFFTQPNTTAHTHLIAAECTNKGVDAEEVYQTFSEISYPALLTYGKIFSRAKKEKNIIWSYVTKEELTDVPRGELDGLIEKLRDVKDTDTALLFKEIDTNKIKVSMRGKFGVDVYKVANKYNGGGHKQAAGCTMQKSMDDAIDIILKEFRK